MPNTLDFFHFSQCLLSYIYRLDNEVRRKCLESVSINALKNGGFHLNFMKNYVKWSSKEFYKTRIFYNAIIYSKFK